MAQRIGIIALAAAAWMATGCALFEGDGGDDDELATHYTLHEGRKTVHAPPLPVETEILVDWHKSDGSKSTVLGFRGFDFGGDGRFEMVQVLNANGSVQSTLFDFDGDGRVDRVDHADAGGAPHPTPATMPVPAQPAPPANAPAENH